jgi:hypothetical protein
LKLVKGIADNTNRESLATRLRRRRFQILLGMLRDKPDPIRILDIGGTAQYWASMAPRLFQDRQIHITLLNKEEVLVSGSNFTALIGDGRAMPQFADREFDIVYSNSTIEHIGTFSDQIRMASEVRRIGQQYCIQTPNRYFPIEPHFLFPFFQFLPLAVRARLLQHFNLGWYSKMRDYQAALREVSVIRLLNRREVQQLFPEAVIFEEAFCGLVKSFVAYTGRPDQ